MADADAKNDAKLAGEGDKRAGEIPAIPDQYVCPILGEIMKNPYVDSDGNSYEKDAIMEWVEQNPLSPLTRNPLRADQLVPNRALKQIIEEFRRSVLGETPDNDIDAKSQDAKTAKHEKESSNLNRKPLMLFALLDCSGSMGSPCGTNADGESDGYTRLDLVKHTMNTVITSLTSSDKVCIIKFSTVATVVANLTNCSPENQRDLKDIVNSLEPDGQTNIWDALRASLDNIAAQGSNAEGYNVDVYLLTDGEPNINPPGPIETTLTSYFRIKEREGAFVRPKINTFGYGYNLDSQLCYNICMASNGGFGFIPDSTMVGTVFINALSQSLVGDQTDYRNTASADAKEEPVEAVAQESKPLFDQVIDETIVLLDKILATPLRLFPNRDHLIGFLSWIAVKKAEAASGDGADAKTLELIEGLLIDCSDNDDANLGQIWKACDRDYFKKWGRHYILSVATAFRKRMCINFKDKAMQIFRSDEFKTEQERIEDVFIQLPPPKPSITNYSRPATYGGTSTYNPPAAPVSMTSYYNQSGGCFSGDSIVYTISEETAATLKAGTPLLTVAHRTPVSHLQMGQLVLSLPADAELSPRGQNQHMSTQLVATPVECVVKLPYAGAMLHRLGEMAFTPYHPFAIASHSKGKFVPQFPCECKCAEAVDGPSFVFDVVLENRGLLAAPLGANDATGDFLVAATIGHKFCAPKFAHAYFGSEAIVTDLSKHRNYAKGYLELKNIHFTRDPDTLLVTKLSWNDQIGSEPSPAMQKNEKNFDALIFCK